ncbi:DUF547 domain-containing protein [Aquimarina sp. SS2-1]|uniref:DUF547 domain-containing protein n=1 Tax=Aquimarina besae TaxID=3342247 RepID=UPI00366CB211
MQKVLIVITVLSIIGCNSNTKKNKINTNFANDSVTGIVIPKLGETDSIFANKYIENKKSKDSILAITKSKDSEQKISKEDDQSDEIKNIQIAQKEEKKKEVTPENSGIKPDHSAWNTLTNKFVSSTGKVDYNGFKSQSAKVELYLKHLQHTAPQKDWTRNEQLAYWFNLYNAATIHLVASVYPVQSIKSINQGKPWDKKYIQSGSNIYSLNEIENTIVRPNFNEPRLHVAFNCAAVSCPKLLNEAFTPNKLNQQLNTLSKTWINDPDKNKITDNSIEISKIFEWYVVDFKKGVIPFINKYSNTKVNDSAKVRYLEYNWDLND